MTGHSPAPTHALQMEEIPLGSPRLKEFVRFPWRLYRGDPCWTPPLNAEYLGNRLLGFKGLLTPNHPYHRHAEVTHFLCWRGDRPVGRIAAAINRNYNDFHKTSIGSFSLFESVDDYEVAQAMLDRARQWVAERGMSVLRGPGEYSNATHERQGILIEGFEHPPTVECTHNPPYYAGLLERYGFTKAKDYLAFIGDLREINVALVKKLASKVPRKGVETRPIVMKNLRAEVRSIIDIYNEAWKNNWGFLPLSGEDADAIADSLRFIADPELIRLSYVNGEPAAVIGIIPDPNRALRPGWKWYGDSDLVRTIRLFRTRRRIKHTRGMFFGIKTAYRNLGLPALVAQEFQEIFQRKSYLDSEASLVLEDNDAIIKVIRLFGVKYYKRWRIYDLPLAPACCEEGRTVPPTGQVVL